MHNVTMGMKLFAVAYHFLHAILFKMQILCFFFGILVHSAGVNDNLVPFLKGTQGSFSFQAPRIEP